MTEAPALALDGLTKSFGSLVVSDAVSLSVRPGEIHALIGPNGAGKTTLIHQVSGHLRPDAGRIALAGTDVTAMAPHRRARLGLSRTFQITSVIPAATARQNVVLALRPATAAGLRLWPDPAGDAALAARAGETLALVGLEGRIDIPASDLSHGERRALELAMALAPSPRVLLLDEPMAGTGREESAHLLRTLAALKGRCAMLLVEHDMHAVFSLADRVSVLVGGRIVASGAPDAVRADPAVRAAYLGDEAALC